MVEQKYGVKTLLCRWLAQETRGLFGGIAGGVIGGAFTFTVLHYVSPAASIGSTDALSIANMYIVYTSFVIAAVALFLTIAGLIFTQHFSMEKQAHLTHAFTTLIRKLKADDSKTVEIVKELMKNREVVQYFDDHVKEKLDEILRARMAHAGQQAHQARDEQDELKGIANDLERGNKLQQQQNRELNKWLR